MKILKLLKKDISSQLNDIFLDIFNIFYWCLYYNLKTAKVIPAHKKEYKPMLLSNLDKIFEKLMHNRLNDFLEKK